MGFPCLRFPTRDVCESGGSATPRPAAPLCSPRAAFRFACPRLALACLPFASREALLRFRVKRWRRARLDVCAPAAAGHSQRPAWPSVKPTLPGRSGKRLRCRPPCGAPCTAARRVAYPSACGRSPPQRASGGVPAVHRKASSDRMIAFESLVLRGPVPAAQLDRGLAAVSNMRRGLRNRLLLECSLSFSTLPTVQVTATAAPLQDPDGSTLKKSLRRTRRILGQCVTNVLT